MQTSHIPHPPLEERTDCSLYCTIHSDTMVNNIFAFGPDGKVFLCAINFPGSWHDGSIMANILPYIHNNIGMYKICINQGFLLSVQLDRSKLEHLLLIYDLPYYTYPTFISHCVKQVNGAWGACKAGFLIPRKGSLAIRKSRSLQFQTEIVGLNQKIQCLIQNMRCTFVEVIIADLMFHSKVV